MSEHNEDFRYSSTRAQVGDNIDSKQYPLKNTKGILEISTVNSFEKINMKLNAMSTSLKRAETARSLLSHQISRIPYALQTASMISIVSSFFLGLFIAISMNNMVSKADALLIVTSIIYIIIYCIGFYIERTKPLLVYESRTIAFLKVLLEQVVPVFIAAFVGFVTEDHKYGIQLIVICFVQIILEIIQKYQPVGKRSCCGKQCDCICCDDEYSQIDLLFDDKHWKEFRIQCKKQNKYNLIDVLQTNIFDLEQMVETAGLNCESDTKTIVHQILRIEQGERRDQKKKDQHLIQPNHDTLTTDQQL